MAIAKAKETIRAFIEETLKPEHVIDFGRLDFAELSLGEGGFGTVEVATLLVDTSSSANVASSSSSTTSDILSTNIEVAVKKLKSPVDLNSGELKKDVLREVAVMLGANNERLVKLYGVSYRVDQRGMPELYFVMELVHSGSIRPYLRTMKPELKWRVLKDLTSGLAYMHNELRVAHRDIKPENILLVLDKQSSTSVKLCDFGLARSVDVFESGACDLSITGTMVTASTPCIEMSENTRRTMGSGAGTPFYLAPEQLRVNYDPEYNLRRVDMHALGVTLSEILCFAKPYGEIYHKLAEQRLEVANLLPPLLRSIIQDCVAFSPMDRPTIDEVQQRIGSIDKEEIVKQLKRSQVVGNAALGRKKVVTVRVRSRGARIKRGCKMLGFPSIPSTKVLQQREKAIKKVTKLILLLDAAGNEADQACTSSCTGCARCSIVAATNSSCENNSDLVALAVEQMVLLHGMGGLGKTVLASLVVSYLASKPNRFAKNMVACGEDEELSVLAANFPDGALWLTVGVGRSKNQFVELQRQLLHFLLGSSEFYKKQWYIATSEEGREKIAKASTNKKILLVLDDVWTEADLEPFRSLRAPSKMFVTSRNADMIVGRAMYKLPTLREDEALELLLAHANTNVESEERYEWATLNIDEKEAIRGILGRCSGLPLMIAGLGSIVGTRSSSGEKLGWENVMLRRETMSGGEELMKTVKTSVSFLPDSELKERYFDLAVFTEDALIPVSVVAMLWKETGGYENKEAVEKLRTLANRSLVQEERNGRFIRIHDLFRQFLVLQRSEEETRRCHQAIVSAYRRKSLGELSVERFPTWSKIPIDVHWDGYFTLYIEYHIRESRLHMDLMNSFWGEIHLLWWLIAKAIDGAILGISCRNDFSSSLGRLGRPPQTFISPEDRKILKNRLLALLHRCSSEGMIVSTIAWALGQLFLERGVEEIVQALLKWVYIGSEECRVDVCHALGSLAQYNDAEVINVLADVMDKDECMSVRMTAEVALTKLRQASSECSSWCNEKEEKIIAMIEEENDPKQLTDLIQLIGKRGGEKSVGVIVSCLWREREIRKVAQIALLSLSQRFYRMTISHLLSLLLSTHKQQEIIIYVNTLGKITLPGDIDVTRALIPHLSNACPIVRRKVAKSLQFVGSKGYEGAILATLPLLRDSNREVSRQAAKALRRMVLQGNINVIQELLVILSHEEEEDIRVNAVELLGYVSNVGDEKVKKFILRLLGDAHWAIRKEAADTLGKICIEGDSTVVACLLPLLSDPDGDVRKSAVEVLGKISEGDEETTLKVLPLLEDPYANWQGEYIVQGAAKITLQRFQSRNLCS